MKKSKLVFDIILSLLLLGLSVATIAPSILNLMPNALQMVLFVVAFVLVAIFLVFLWHEKPEDERELINQNIASRAAYIVGSLVLIVALVVQGFQHNVDPIIPIALFAMIVTKLIVQNLKDNG